MRRASVASIVLVAVVAALSASLARAAGLPAEVVTSTSPPAATIEQYIVQAISDLKSTDPAKQQAGRDALVNFVAPAPQPPVPSPSFLAAYSRTLNRQLPALAKASDMRTRLNAAVATARVAEKIENDELVETISGLLKDQNEAVAIWGMKAAKFVAPRSAKGAGLIQLVTETAKRFPSSATVGYQALVVGETPAAGVVDAIHKLMESRAALYAHGIPADALADTLGMRQLVDRKWWQAQSAPQQAKTLQLLVNFANAASQRVQGNVNNEERESMSALVRQINRCVAAIAELQNKPALKKKMDDGVRGLVAAASAQQVAQQGDAIVAAVRADFPNVTAPQPLPATKPATTNK